MQNVLNHVSYLSSHLTGKCTKKLKIYQRSIGGGYYTTLSYIVIHDVFVLFTFAKVDVIWFDSLVSKPWIDQKVVYYCKY